VRASIDRHRRPFRVPKITIGKPEQQRLSGRLGSSSDAFATAYHPSSRPQGDVIQHGAPLDDSDLVEIGRSLKMAKGDGAGPGVTLEFLAERQAGRRVVAARQSMQ